MRSHAHAHNHTCVRVGEGGSLSGVFSGVSQGYLGGISGGGGVYLGVTLGGISGGRIHVTYVCGLHVRSGTVPAATRRARSREARGRGGGGGREFVLAHAGVPPGLQQAHNPRDVAAAARVCRSMGLLSCHPPHLLPMPLARGRDRPAGASTCGSIDRTDRLGPNMRAPPNEQSPNETPPPQPPNESLPMRAPQMRALMRAPHESPPNESPDESPP